MKAGLYYYILLTVAASIVRTRSDEAEEKRSSKSENLEDFPLDENDPSSDFLRQSNITADYSDRENYEEPSMESKQKIIFQKLIAEAMKKPGAYQTFAQVLPILRMMSAPQRLALAGMVMKQLTGAGEGQFSDDRNNTMNAELMLPISMDVAKMFHGDPGTSSLGRSTGGYDTFYPNRNVPTNFYRPTGTTIYPARRPPIQPNRRTVLDIPPELRPPPPPPGLINPALRPPSPALPPNKLRPTLQIIAPHRNNAPGPHIEDDCKLVGTSLCSEVGNYPETEILETIESIANKAAFDVLLESTRNSTEDYSENPRPLERRISDDDHGPQICSSSITRVRPKRGKAANGQWKYIVNTGEYTQTLRLEMCQKPKEPCSLLAENYQSECVQTFNYHRLVTWDKSAGLTMDIFRVPTCCSCHITGLPTFMKPPHKKYPIQDEFNEDNFVVDEEPAPVQRLPPPRLVPRKTAAHSTPKRDSTYVRRPSPPHQEAEESKRVENTIRRTQNTPIKYVESKPTGPDSRQGAIPAAPSKSEIEELLAEVAHHSPPSGAPKPASKRINYSYHPIIDFFKSSPPGGPLPQTVDPKTQRRMDIADMPDVDDWTPIDGPRSL
nr:PREDICTED: uncharacterized protein LOC109043417 isoform X1 [Bemisia tabaci]